MSTCTVNSPKKSQGKARHAKWDDEKTKYLLELFEQEINCGNCPSGVYSKQAWTNIISKFNAKTGLVYNKEQIKNKQDNLRREFTKWEALIGKEMGLGWDCEKRTLSAPDSWWLENAQTELGILKYREGGPLHLDLLQKVFGGIIANGFFAYIPTMDDTFGDTNIHLDSVADESLLATNVAEHEGNFCLYTLHNFIRRYDTDDSDLLGELPEEDIELSSTYGRQTREWFNVSNEESKQMESFRNSIRDSLP